MRCEPASNGPRSTRTDHQPSIAAALQRGGDVRGPNIAADQRQALLDRHRDDIALLKTVLGEAFVDGLSPSGRGSFRERVSPTSSSGSRV